MTYATVNPYTLETVKEFPDATEADVEAALAAADDAFRAWFATPVEKRAEVVQKISEHLAADAEELARLLTLEMGRISSSKGKTLTALGEAKFILAFFSYYASKGPELLAPRRVENADGSAVIRTFEPLGVLVAVEPWNYPLYQVARVLAPQLVAGNVVILKHAEINPQTALELERVVREAAREAGAPEAIFTNVFATHDQVATMIADPRVAGVALTGSERAGAVIAAEAGQALKKCTMELGGSDAFVVLDDADIDKAAVLGARNRMQNGGQMCIASKRFIVADSVYDEFKEKYVAEIATFTAGDPAKEETLFGPMSSKRQADTVKDQVERARAAGATYTPIGAPVPEQGAFVQAGILEGVDADNPVHDEEIFGPVAIFFRVADDDEAVAVANDTPYGLGGAVMGADLERAAGVAGRINAGMVHINNAGGTGPNIPFGGVKRSGFGRECAEDGILEFVNKKWVTDPASIKG